MAPRRASARGGISTPATRRRAQGGVRKDRCPRQAPNWYGQKPGPQESTPGEGTNEPSSSSQDPELTTAQYSHTPGSNKRIHVGQSLYPGTISPPQITPAPPREIDSHTLSLSTSYTRINLSTMRDLLRSHEQEIVDRVIIQLGSQKPNPPNSNPPEPEPPYRVDTRPAASS